MEIKRKFHVCGSHSRKIGIVASTYDELLEKCIRKFEKGNEIVITLEDGTEIDEEFFEVLDCGSSLCIKQKTEKLHLAPLLTKLEAFVYEYAEMYMKAGNRLEKLLETSGPSSLLEIINELTLGRKPVAVKDPDWFQGLDTKFKTKEAVLRNSAETRMRGYMQKAKKDLGTANKKHEELIKFLQAQLKLNKYHSFYFDRSEKKEHKLCNEEGRFLCFGKYNKDSCSSCHSINPYDSREERIIFSTWNFDHVLEKSRTVIPMIKTVLETHSLGEINLQYVYELLFSHVDPSNKNLCGNLKLVHIVCHDKTPHEGCCDLKKLLNL